MNSDIIYLLGMLIILVIAAYITIEDHNDEK